MVRVVIVNFKQVEYTIACVESVQKSTETDMRILVIDNGSPKTQFEKLRASLHKSIDMYWSEQNIGYVGAVNYGLSVGTMEDADYVLVLNNDTIVAPDAIKCLVDCAARHDNKCIVSGKVYHYDDRSRLQTTGSVYKDRSRLTFTGLGRNEIDVGQYDLEREVDLLDDIFWLLPLEVIQKTGTYNRLFWFNAEQADYALRAKKLGYKLVYTPEAKIWHKGSLSIGGRVSNPVLLYWDAQSNMLLHYLHLSRAGFWSFYSRNLLRCLISASASLFRGNVQSKMQMVFARLRGMLSIWFILFSGTNKGKNPYLS